MDNASIVSKQVKKATSVVVEESEEDKKQAKPQWHAELLLALSFGFVGFCFSGLHVHIFSMMASFNIADKIAVASAALIGPCQVISRFSDMILGRHITPVGLGILSILCMLTGISCLLITAYTGAYQIYQPIFLFAIFFGFGQGLTNIVRGSIPLYLFGNIRYGAITGRINSIRILMTAIAPITFAMVIKHFGAEYVILLMGLCLLTSIYLLYYVQRHWKSI